MQHAWTAARHDGPDHLELWLNWTTVQHDGPNHLELLLSWTAAQHDGPNHLELCLIRGDHVHFVSSWPNISRRHNATP